MENTFKPATLKHPITGDRVAVKSKEEADKYFSSNYELDKAPPASVERTRDTTTTGNSTYEDIRKAKPTAKLMDYIKEGIQKKQGYNKDIQSGRERWRTSMRDTSPFSDEAFQHMSPGAQASMRASKRAAASSHLQGLKEEEAYRGTRLSDTLDSIRAVKDDASSEESTKLNNTLKRLQIKALADEGGYDYDTGLKKDYSSSTAKNIANAIKIAEGNLGYDYKVANRQEIGAYQFMPATWKSWAESYAKENGINRSLAFTKENQDAVAEWKIQGWLGEGYTPQQVAAKWNSGDRYGEKNIGKGISTITDEPYDVPEYVGRFTDALDANTPDKVSPEEQVLMDLTGLTVDELDELSDEELQSTLDAAQKDLDISLNTGFEGERKTAAYQDIDKMIADETTAGTTAAKIEAKIIRAFSPEVTASEIRASMIQYGYKWDGYNWGRFDG